VAFAVMALSLSASHPGGLARGAATRVCRSADRVWERQPRL